VTSIYPKIVLTLRAKIFLLTGVMIMHECSVH